MRSGLPGTGTGTTQWFRKTWRKLHLSRGNILTSEPTTEHVGDETVAARSSRTCRRTGWSTDFRSPDGCFRIRSPCQVCQRNQLIEPVAEHCRIAWQAAVGDNQRSGIETQIGRRKPVISDWRHAKNTEKQTIEKHSRQRWTECQPSGGQTANASGADS